MHYSTFRKGYFKKKKKQWYAVTGHPYPYLLSIHIPKTAGRTFQKILQAQYGHDSVLCLNHKYLSNRGEQLKDYAVHDYPVIHGHLPFPQISGIAHQSSKYITWLRHPVERVISNYYYYYHNELPRRMERNPNAGQIDLETFIERPKRCNLMTRYLDGADIEKLFFVGFQEEFKADVIKLGRKLRWRISKIPLQLRVNENRNTRQSAQPPSAKLIAKIEEYNAKDLALYAKARELSRQGYWD